MATIPGMGIKFATSAKYLAAGLVFIALGVLVFLYMAAGVQYSSDKTLFVIYCVLGGTLVATGMVSILRYLSSPAALDNPSHDPGSLEDADYIVRQQQQNYQLLRAQTTQGFLLSSGFMIVGLVILTSSFFAPSLGLNVVKGMQGLGILAGIVTEFISGTALAVYRQNFNRLNRTSDRLDASWRILAAYKLTSELPEEERTKATVSLITCLASSPLG